jgi:hypothetical protein
LKALDEDLENKEADARKNVNTLVAKALSFADENVKRDAAILNGLAGIYDSQTLLEKQRKLIQKILDVASKDQATPLKSRIAIERISRLAKELKNSSKEN